MVNAQQSGAGDQRDRPRPKKPVEAMKQGAFDYIGKPLNLEKLMLLVERAAERGPQGRGTGERSRKPLRQHSALTG